MARITLRLPDDLHQALKAHSRATGESLNETIVSLLRQRQKGAEHEAERETPLEAERRRIREALGDLVVKIDPQDFEPYLGPPMDPAKRKAILESIPPMDPPLSHAIIEEREESPF